MPSLTTSYEQPADSGRLCQYQALHGSERVTIAGDAYDQRDDVSAGMSWLLAALDDAYQV